MKNNMQKTKSKCMVCKKGKVVGIMNVVDKKRIKHVPVCKKCSIIIKAFVLYCK